MKKYNCNNTLDYAHEFTRMCNTFHDCNDCPMRDLSCGEGNITAEHIKRVQAWSDAHPEIVLTDKQVEIFKALNLLGFRYIAQDRDGAVWAYTDCPEKGIGRWGGNEQYLNLRSEFLRAGVFDAISPLVNWSDREPLNIAEALEQAEVKP